MTEQRHAALGKQEFEALVRSLLPDLYRYATWLSRDRAVAEDVVQEALLRAWRSVGALRDGSAAKSWLLTIVRRENARWFQRQPARAMDVDVVAGMEAALQTPSVDTDVLDMRRAIARLPRDFREPLVMQILLGLKAEEIAEVMELSSGAVLTRLYRARKQLREALKKSATGRVRMIDS